MSSYNDSFLRACRGQATPHIPVWYMRQAGRYQPEYREIRKKHSLLDICRRPDVCAEVTLLPVEQLGVDAAILFSDIMLPLGPAGVDFDIVENVGPVISNPIATPEDVERIADYDMAAELPYVGETVRILKDKLKVPLIGFSGAPFTLASYMIEGGPSKNYHKTKAFMYGQPEAWQKLLHTLADVMANYLKYQVQNGAAAIQVFDSWVGHLSAPDYEKYVQPATSRLFLQLKSLQVPLIHFGVINGHLLRQMHECGATVVGLDWRTEIKQGRAALGDKVPLQGNLDPAALLAPREVLEEKVNHILAQVDKPGFIFNLGHGIMPQADVETLRFITEKVHRFKPLHL